MVMLGASSTTVEEDLDAALDDILGDALMEAENPVGVTPGTHMENSRPMPPTLVETEVRVSFIHSHSFLLSSYFCHRPSIRLLYNVSSRHLYALIVLFFCL